MRLPLIHLAAVVSCGLGAGAYFWSSRNQTPVTVKFHNRSILALVSNSVADDNECDFYLVDSERLLAFERLSLVAIKGNPKQPRFRSTGLFPPSIKLD